MPPPLPLRAPLPDRSTLTATPSPITASAPLDSVPSYGHPLFVDFTVSAESVAPGDCTPGPWTPQSALAHAVDVAGFAYDPRQDIIYSKMYPLQRSFGYAYGYDAAALGMDAIIDCEPIFFDYAGKTWMIELWKGQYGLETGCEIGVYNRAHGSTSFCRFRASRSTPPSWARPFWPIWRGRGPG